MIIYINVEDILKLHFRLIEDYGGSHGVRDEGRLLSVEAAPQQVAFGQEQYLTLYDKAAVYLRNIIADHPFVDGNKRTATTVCGVFLLRNGHALTAAPKMLEDFVVQVATNHTDIPTIAAWLAKNTTQTSASVHTDQNKLK